jgi:3-oxoacyl-[acyl-carrier protein] reductase
MKNLTRIPDLHGQVVLITGASSGIGAALAESFADQGAKIGLHYHTGASSAQTIARNIQEKGGEVFLIQGDVSSGEQVLRIVSSTAEHFGRIDGLINNAGHLLGRENYAVISEEKYDAVMDLNCRSVIVASKAAYPWLKKQGGFIINTTSLAGRNGGSIGAGLYGSAKAFVSNVTRGMAKEFIADGIRVNAVSPGVIMTPFHEKYSTPEQLAQMVSNIPLGRLGIAEDCIGAYLFLASKIMSGYIIGQTIEVNGGILMQ